jgi:N-acyl-D-aspartate/D-glutamate deacylase
MLDLVIRNGMVIDGTGAPARRADVGIRGGRIVSVGEVDEPAASETDTDGLAVAPGFIDIHTHYDAAIMWDPYASPSPSFGFTTVIGGNCGFSIAPIDPDRDGDYIARMLARVEGMPLEALEAGLDWNWRTFGEWLDRVEGRLAINAGFLVGHSALRRAVMGNNASETASDHDVEAMKALLDESLRAGGLGFSSSHGGAHLDGDGNPVPSRAASDRELIALSSVVSEHAGTTLEYIVGFPSLGFTDDQVRTMAEMSAAAHRPINWNLLLVDSTQEHIWRSELDAADSAPPIGGRIVALTLPALARMRLSLESGFLFETIPGWEPLFRIPVRERMILLRDAEERRFLAAAAAAAAQAHRERVEWGRYTIVETFASDNQSFLNRTVADIAAECRKDPFDVLLDVAIADELRTGLLQAPRGDDDASWKYRSEVWRDPRVVLGGSDAGAHLDMLTAFTYPVELLGEHVRDRHLLDLEEAVRLITDAPARFYGLTGRGRIEEGYHADLVVFDPATIGPGRIVTEHDLPAGAARLTGSAVGIRSVLVGGVPTIVEGAATGDLPGQLLRSGRDTETVLP